MIVRALQPSDIPVIREIHAKFYNKEFELDELFINSISAFAITDDKDNVICAASIRPIMETVLITDKSVSVRQRRSALYRILDVAEFTVLSTGHSQLHIFVQDEEWVKQLTKENIGFKPTAGRSLVKCL